MLFYLIFHSNPVNTLYIISIFYLWKKKVKKVK